jgi:hypothetical protein
MNKIYTLVQSDDDNDTILCSFSTLEAAEEYYKEVEKGLNFYKEDSNEYPLLSIIENNLDPSIEEVKASNKEVEDFIKLFNKLFPHFNIHSHTDDSLESWLGDTDISLEILKESPYYYSKKDIQWKLTLYYENEKSCVYYNEDLNKLLETASKDPWLLGILKDYNE